MKVAVIGSRSFNDYELMCDVLKNIENINCIVSGGAKGADSLAELYAKENDIPVEIFLPDWKKYGRAAGLIRNKLIIENADFVVAFYDGESKGTKNGIDLAKKLNKKLKVVLYAKI